MSHHAPWSKTWRNYKSPCLKFNVNLARQLSSSWLIAFLSSEPGEHSRISLSCSFAIAKQLSPFRVIDVSFGVVALHKHAHVIYCDFSRP